MKRFHKILAVCILGAAIVLVASRVNHKLKVGKEHPLAIGTLEEAAMAKEWPGRVYLASYPRSGNHWMRYLVEEATGIATSSTYIDPDPQHLATLFPWGGYCCDHGYEGHCRYPEPGETSLIKTHFPAMHISWFDGLPYRFAIRIIRHPVDCFYSFYLWERTQSHKRAEPFIPRKRLKNCIRNWRRFQEYWDAQENVLTLRYEDLVHDPLPYLAEILEKIGYPVYGEDLERALAKYPAEKRPFKHLSHYSEDDLELIQNKLGPLMRKYGYEKITPETPPSRGSS
jgi:hypothetical protein